MTALRTVKEEVKQELWVYLNFAEQSDNTLILEPNREPECDLVTSYTPEMHTAAIISTGDVNPGAASDGLAVVQTPTTSYKHTATEDARGASSSKESSPT
jgi:hypothetical protein